MSYHWESREHLKASIRSTGLWGHGCWFLSAIFALIGIIAAAADIAIGLGAVVWFLLAILTMVASIPFFLGMVLAWYLETTSTKKEEKTQSNP